MNSSESNCIIRNIENLCRSTTNIYELVLILFSAGIITESEKEIINSQISTYQKCSEFYSCLLRKGKESYQVLLNALESTRNDYAFELLNNVTEESFGYNNTVSNFVGREEEIEKIRNILVQKRQVIISGIGGIGKTSIAEKYIELYKVYYRSRIVWIDGTSNVSCRNSLEAYLTETHRGGGNKTEATLFSQLFTSYNRDKKPWLLVVDNMTNVLVENTLGMLFQRNRGDSDYSHLLVTCLEGKSVSNFTTLISEIQLEGLSVKNAISILNQVLPTQEAESPFLRELASLLCCSPLAIQQAFAYIDTQYKVLPSKTDKYKYYLEEIMSQTKEYQRMLGNSKFGSTKTLHAVIEVAVNKVREELDGKIAVILLQHLSFIGSRKIDVKIIPHLLKSETVNEYKITHALSQLTKFKLIESRDDFVDIHEIVQLHVRNEMEGNLFLQLTASKRLHNCIFSLYDSIAELKNVSLVIPHILFAFHHTAKYCTATIFSNQIMLLVLATMSEISDNLMRQMLSPFLHDSSLVFDIVALSVSFLIVSILLIYAVSAFTRLNQTAILHKALTMSCVALLIAFQLIQIQGIIWNNDEYFDHLRTVGIVYKITTTVLIIVFSILWFIQTIRKWRRLRNTNVVMQVHILYVLNWVLGSMIIFAELYLYRISFGNSDKDHYDFYDPFSVPKVKILLFTSVVVLLVSAYFEIICKVPFPQFSMIGKPKALFHFSLSCCVFEICAWVWKKKLGDRRYVTLVLVVMLLLVLITMPLSVQKKTEYSLDFVIWNLEFNEKKRLYILLNQNHSDLLEIEEKEYTSYRDIEGDEDFLRLVYDKLGKNHRKSSLSVHLCKKLTSLAYQNSHFEVARKYYENIALVPEATPKQIYNLMAINYKINRSTVPQSLMDQFNKFRVENSPLLTPAVLHKFNILKTKLAETSGVNLEIELVSNQSGNEEIELSVV